MSYLFIGIGQSGSALLDATFHHKNIRKVARPLTIDSAFYSSIELKNIDKKNRYILSEYDGFVCAKTQSILILDEDFGTDQSHAYSTAQQHYSSLLGILNQYMMDDGASGTSIPLAIIFTGLGETMGAGVAPNVARALSELSGGTMKIIVVGILPVTSDIFSKEIIGINEAKNCSLAIAELKNFVNSFILVDNQRISYGDNIASMYLAYNEYVATAISDLMGGIEGIGKSHTNINLPTINAEDIINVTSIGAPGFAVLGRASVVSKSLIQYFVPVGPHKEIDILTLAGVCIEKLTTSIDVKLAKKNLAVLCVPPYYLKKEKNTINTKSLEEFLRNNSKDPTQNRMGISTTKRSIVSLTILFTFDPEDIPRLYAIEDAAKSAINTNSTKYDGNSNSIEESV